VTTYIISLLQKAHAATAGGSLAMQMHIKMLIKVVALLMLQLFLTPHMLLLLLLLLLLLQAAVPVPVFRDAGCRAAAADVNLRLPGQADGVSGSLCSTMGGSVGSWLGV
jgi:hypothetical protein